MPRQPRKIPGVRLNLYLPSTAKDRLERLEEATDAGSMADVIRRALTLYEVVIEATDSGEKIVIIGDDGEKRLIVL